MIFHTLHHTHELLILNNKSNWALIDVWVQKVCDRVLCRDTQTPLRTFLWTEGGSEPCSTTRGPDAVTEEHQQELDAHSFTHPQRQTAFGSARRSDRVFCVAAAQYLFTQVPRTTREKLISETLQLTGMAAPRSPWTLGQYEQILRSFLCFKGALLQI